MKQLLKISEMIPYLPTALKDAIYHVAKNTGNKTDELELHRHTHSEKAKINEIDPTSRKSLAYVSYRTQDRDDEIVIPKSLKLDEFRKYSSVLVNHNYSLLPVGSDEWIDADDYGIKALTVHADTGMGTLANVVWDLVRQGHLKGRSVGFVPTSYTKPGARDWDHVANQLQGNWKEFDKGRAEKSVSRIITGGILLEHSFVSVPCNTDAELIGVVKSMNLDGKIIKQLGLEEKQEKVPCFCDECGYVADAVLGSKCPECKTGDMKSKSKEKAIEVRVISKGMGTLSVDDLRAALNTILSPRKGSLGEITASYVQDIFEDHFIYGKDGELFSQGYSVVENEPQLVGEPVKVERRTNYVRVVSKGGPGSGNFGHEGRPGEIGGSGSGGGGSDKESSGSKYGSVTPSGHGTGLSVREGSKDSKEIARRVVREDKPFMLTISSGTDKGKESWGELISLHSSYDDAKTAASSFEKKTGIVPYTSRASDVRSIASAIDDEVNNKKSFHSDAFEKFVKEVNGEYCVFSHQTGKNFGCYPTKEEAEARLAQIHKFKSEKASKVQPCECDECGAEDEVVPGSPCQEDECEGTMQVKKEQQGRKEFHPEIKVVRPAPQIKVLYVPPDADLIAKGVSDAVEHTLARKTGRIL